MKQIIAMKTKKPSENNQCQPRKSIGEIGLLPDIPGLSSTQLQALAEAAIKENEQHPELAIIGECGVGKSTTLNVLFNAGCDTSDTIACTKTPKSIDVPLQELTGTNGKIRFWDMPGLNESIEEDKKHIKLYKKIIPQCDVVLWVLGEGRRYRFMQETLQQLALAIPNLSNRLVIGLNKVDTVKGGPFVSRYELPTEEQAKNIDTILNDAYSKIQEIIPLDRSRFVAYSAQKHYRLPDLFGAMLEACPRERTWVLNNRASLADFFEKRKELKIN